MEFKKRPVSWGCCSGFLIALSLLRLTWLQVSKAGKKAVAVNAASAYSVGGGRPAPQLFVLGIFAAIMSKGVKLEGNQAETKHVWSVVHDSCL